MRKLVLVLIIVSLTAGCGGGGNSGGSPGITAGAWDVSQWDNATWGP